MADRVNVVNPSGELVSIPADRVDMATQAGYRLATPADEETYAAKEQWGDRPFSAAAAGAFGWLVGGPEGRETIENLEKYNPGAATLGTIASYLAPGAIVKGARALPAVGRLAGPAAAGALAPQLGITALGSATERYLTSKLAQGAVTLGTRGLVEGAAVGGFDYLNEVALGDDVELTAEQLFEAMAGGGLIGGATGVGMGAILRGLNKASTKLTSGPGAGDETGFLTRVFGRAVEKLSGGQVTADDFITLRKGKNLQIAKEAPKTRQRVFEESRDLLRSADDLERALRSEQAGFVKESHVRRAMPDNPDFNAISAETGLIMQEADGVFGDFAIRGDYWGPKVSRVGKAVVKRVNEELNDMAAKATQAATAKEKAVAVHVGVDRIKRFMQEAVYRDLRKAAPESMQAAEALKLGNKFLKTRVEPHLERADLFGDAGLIQQRVNKSASEMLDSVKQFRRVFSDTVDVVDEVPVFQLKDKAWWSYINKGMNDAKGQEHGIVAGSFEGWRDWARTLDDALELTPTQRANVKLLQQNLDKVDGLLDEAKHATHLENLYKGIEGAEGKGRELAYAALVAGGGLFGTPGVIGAIAIKPFLQPAMLLNTLARLSTWAGESGLKYQRALNKVNAKGLAPATAAGFREYNKRAEHVQNLPTGQQLAEQMLQNMPEVVAAAPDTAMALTMTADRYREAASAKMPLADTGYLGWPKATLSKTETSRWLRQLDAKPTRLLDDLADARVSMDQVRFIQAVYPKWFEKFSEDLTNEILDLGQRGKMLPFKLRVQAAMVLKVPTDPMLSFSYISQMKAVYSSGGLRQQAQSSKRSMGQPQISQNYKTGSQNVDEVQ